MGRELEVKLEVPAGSAIDAAAVPEVVSLGSLAGVATAVVRPVRHLDATYWDTPTLDLLRRGATLRRRTGDGDVPRWTLKVPAGATGTAGGLDRHEHDVDDPAEEPPAALVRRAEAVGAVGPLEVVARLVTDRTAVELADHDGGVLVEVADDRVRAEVPGRPPVAWRELEAELASGADDAVLEAVVGALRGAGAVPADPRPKLDRALAHRHRDRP